MDKEELKRYNRQIILSEIGLKGQEILKAARVLIIGAGGLGCPVLQYLTAAGVGTLAIVDDDKIDISNLHRQILYTAADIGKSKAETAAAKLKALNPFVHIDFYPTRLTIENAEEIISKYNLIVDGSDNFETRYLVNDTCVKLDKTLVFGSIFGFEGQISVFNYKGGPTYRCVFPEVGEAPNCEVNGVLGVLPGIVGTFMANETLKILLEIGEPLSGRLMVVNVLENIFNLFKITRVATLNDQPTSNTNKFQIDSTYKISEDQLEEMLENQTEQIFLIDVREPNEFEAGNLGGINIPLSEIANELSLFPLDKKIIFYCQSGRRSKLAFDIVKEEGFEGDVYWV